MDTALLSKIELGQRIPTEKQTAAFAAFFGVPIEELEAKRIAERFWMENRDNPAAGKAVAILRETAPVYIASTLTATTPGAQSPAQPAGAAAGTQTQHQPQENHP
jgi:transcriptional regulator with XRE-family HTH domain